MRFSQRMAGAIGILLPCLVMATSSSFGQDATQPQKVVIPPTVATLEGVPTVRIDAAADGSTRRVLDAAEAAKDRLTVSVVDGQYYWTSRGNRLLRLDSSGEFTYLSSEPGKYIRLTRLNDKIAYVEHLDMASGSVTWWGELRIVVGK